VHECEWSEFLGITRFEICVGYNTSKTRPAQEHYDYSSLILSGDTNQISNGIDLQLTKQVRGQLVPELALLTSLRYLDIGFQRLRGTIPADFAALSSLKQVILYDNELTGTFPAMLYDSEVLWLSHNDFDESPIPKIMENASLALQSFLCIKCQLTGSIPPELFQSGSLRELLIGENNLSGKLPTEIGYATQLGKLLLNENDLSSTLPTELGLLANSMYSMEMTENRLSGPIPSEVGEIKRLRILNLIDNRLTGPLPTELKQLRQLTELKLSTEESPNRGLSGPVPLELFVYEGVQNSTGADTETTVVLTFPRLVVLWLERTNLSGQIPTVLGLLTGLVDVRMGWNRNMEGMIPSELGMIGDSLTVLSLANSNIDGTFPVELKSLTNLKELRIDGNAALSGTAPASICDTDILVLGCDGDDVPARLPPSTGDTLVCGCHCSCL